MKFELEDVRVSEEFYKNIKRLEEEVLSEESKREKKHRVLVNSTTEATIFLKMNLHLLKERYKNSKYTARHDLILYKVHELYPDADYRQLSKILNKNFIFAWYIICILYIIVCYFPFLALFLYVETGEPPLFTYIAPILPAIFLGYFLSVILKD